MSRGNRKLETRRRILESALRLFARVGFDDTSIKSVAASAKVAHGTVFLHFMDKAQLYGEVIQLAGDRFLTRMRRCPATTHGTLVETLERWISDLARSDDASTLLRTDNRTHGRAAVVSVDVCFVEFWRLRLESWFGGTPDGSERLRELARLIVLTASSFAAVRLEGNMPAKSAALAEDFANAIETMATPGRANKTSLTEDVSDDKDRSASR